MTEIVPEHVKNNLYLLAYEREQRGLSHRELQKLTGVREDILVAYESGKVLPTAGKYNRLAEYFGWEVWQ